MSSPSRLLLLFVLLLASCSPPSAQVTQPTDTQPADTQPSQLPPSAIPATPTLTSIPTSPDTPTPKPLPTAWPTVTPAPTKTPLPTQTLPPLSETPVEIRWFVGVGAGTDANQVAIQQRVVRDFNASHPNIKLTLDVVPYNDAYTRLAEQFAAGEGPDIVGPMGWMAASSFPGEWFDLELLVTDADYDLDAFPAELVEMYRTPDGLVGLPFAVYPAAVFYNKRLFMDAGLNYPPAAYGEAYIMPDGTQVEWNWETLRAVARLLTLDASGKNATQAGFNRERIVQYGYIPQWQEPVHLASFWRAASLYDPKSRTAVIPEAWDEAWTWYYDGMWGEQPFIPNRPALNTSRFGNGNGFSSKAIAMAVTQSWYIGPNVAGQASWDLGALPSYQGQIHGRVDADTFRIWRDTRHPREAFMVLAYFIGPASTDLLRAYGAIPALPADRPVWFDARRAQYSSVTHWEVLEAGLNFPDIPPAEGDMPNFLEAWNRLRSFGDRLASTDVLSVRSEIQTLRRDLEAIFTR